MNHDRVEEYVIATAQKNIRGLLLRGEPGIGKSWNVINTLHTQGYHEEQDYVIIRGHVTPLELFKWMSEHKTKTLIFDDVSGLFESPVSIGLLKNATDTTSRMVTYKTAAHYGITEPTFEFSGSIIIITNDKTIYADSCEAIRSRFIIEEMSMSYFEKLQLIKGIATSEVGEQGMRTILGYIIKHTNPSIEIDVRTTHKLISIYNHVQQNTNATFEELAIGILPPCDESMTKEQIALVSILRASHVAKAYKMYSKNHDVIGVNGGKEPSKANFFRAWKRIRDKLGGIDIETYRKKIQEIDKEVFV